MQEILKVINLTKNYLKNDHDFKALDDINFTLKKGDSLAIVGESGCGKSTLAKIIMGIEKPTSGKIFFNGEDITDWDITKRALAGISFAFQQPVCFKGIGVKDLLSLAAGEK